MSTLYVGIDVSKKSLELSATGDGEKIIGARSVTNDKQGWNAILKWAGSNARKINAGSIHICMESTGVYGQELLEFLQEGDLVVSVVNPARIKGFSQGRQLRVKTDRTDAATIAIFCAKMKPAPTPVTPPEFKELRAFVRHIDYLVECRSEAKGRLESTRNASVRESIECAIKNYDALIDEMEKKIREHIDKHPEIKEDVELMKSIPGISDTTARMLYCELHTARENGKLGRKEQTAHAGLAPMIRQSGTSLNRTKGICKTGSSRLRAGLFFPTMSAIQHNPVIREFFGRLKAKGKSGMVAVVASMRKLLMIVIGVLNNRTPFDPMWHKS